MFYGDGGGKGRGLPRPVFGRDRVARLLRAFIGEGRSLAARSELTWVGGEPGVINFDAKGRLINVFAFEIAGGAIQAIRSVINPDKLAHLGYELSPVARAKG